MSPRIVTQADLEALGPAAREQVEAEMAAINKPKGKRTGLDDGPTLPKPSKHRNQRTIDTETGEMVHSKLEARHRAEYRQMCRVGELKGYAAQVYLVLPGVVTMNVDHLLIDSVTEDGRVIGRLVDSKGKATQDWKNKAKQALDCLGIRVETRRGNK